jgi:SAM-dependent methyltransferase
VTPTARSRGPRPGSPSHPTGSAPPADAGPTHWFEPLADHVGAAYERYSFTKGTAQEVAFLLEALDLRPGRRLLDLGCATGRHSRAFAEHGLAPIGLDVAAGFLTVAAAAAPDVTFVRGDARRLPLADASVDAAISLCQGGFGLTGGPAADAVAPGVEPDLVVLDELRRVLRPGGRLALTAFSSYFAVRDLGEEESFDADAGVLHERTVVHDTEGRPADQDLWTTCYTPRELRLLLARAGFRLDHLWAATPGRYTTDPPSIDTPEHLAVASVPGPR